MMVSEPERRYAIFRAKNGTRTRDPDLGKVVLYQLSYFRNISMFSGVLVSLSVSRLAAVKRVVFPIAMQS